MNNARKLVLTLLVITLLSSFIKTITKTAGIPNLVPFIRDPLLLGMAIYGIGKINFYESRKWPLLLVCTFAFLFSYIYVSLLEDQIFIGLYFVRIYLIPFLFFIAATGAMNGNFQVELRRGLIRFLIHWNNILFATALAIYVMLQAVPSMRNTLFGPDLLPSAWYISGGTWMRMGLPLSGPNTLGLVFAINAFVFLTLLVTGNFNADKKEVSRSLILISTLLAGFGLVLSFSRSSMLLLVVTIPFLLLTPKTLNFQKLFRIMLLAFTMLLLLAVLAMIANEASDGYIVHWLELNASFSDPSMVGHVKSIDDAIDRLPEYIYWGFERGTVGPKAIIFTARINNVENSILAVFYDMGLFVGSLYWLAVLSLFATAYRNRFQLLLLFGFIPPCLLLPQVFEADMIMYFVFIYMALGIIIPATEKKLKKSDLSLNLPVVGA